MTRKKIMVTGGAGFIGSHIVDAYVADGHDVSVIDNLSSGKRGYVNPAARFYECDIRSPEIEKIFEQEKPHILNHHAAQINIRTSVENPQLDLQVNVGGLVNLLEIGSKYGLQKVIFASSGGAVYGEQQAFPAAEDHPAHPINPYGVNKLCGEHYLFCYSAMYNLAFVALRYSNVYGPRQNPHGEAGVIAIFLEKILSGEKATIHGDGTQTRDYIYIDDVVEANRLMLKEAAAGIYNVGTGVETDVNRVFRAICEVTKRPQQALYGPPKLGEILRSSLVAERLKREGKWFSKMVLAEGIQRTAVWFQQERARLKSAS